MVVDGTSCCVILECLVTSIACIKWPVSLLTKRPTTICHFASVVSSNFLLKRKSLLQKFTRDFSVLMEVCAWVRTVFEDGWNILKMGTQASRISLGAVALEKPQLNTTRREWMRSFKMTGLWLWVQTTIFSDLWRISCADNGGNSENSVSVSSDGWNGNLQMGNFKTPSVQRSGDYVEK